MRMAFRVLCTATGLLVWTTRLAAQTSPMPAVPEEADPLPTRPPDAGGNPPAPSLPDSAASTRPQPWEYAFGVGVGWDSNIDFLTPDGPRDVAAVPRVLLTRVFAGPRGQIRATGAGRWTGYPHHEELRQYYADASLEGNYRSSARTNWRGSASYEVGDTASSRILLEQGVALPRVRTRSTSGTFGLTRKLGTPRTSLRLDARVYRTEFDAPGLIDGESARATLGLERQLSARNTAVLEYSLENVMSDQAGRAYLTHFASLRWTRVLSPRSAVLLEAGASQTPDAARAGLEHGQSFFGGASFSRHVSRSAFTLFIRREVTPAFGIGLSRLELRAGLGTTIPMGRVWELQMFASHVQPENRPAAGRAFASTDDALLVLGRHLGRQIAVTAEARYRRQGATTTLPMIQGIRAGLFVTLLTPAARTDMPVPGPDLLR